MAPQCFRSKEPDPPGISVASGRSLYLTAKGDKKSEKERILAFVQNREILKSVLCITVFCLFVLSTIYRLFCFVQNRNNFIVDILLEKKKNRRYILVITGSYPRFFFVIMPIDCFMMICHFPFLSL